MTPTDFLKNYYCSFEKHQNNDSLVIISKVISRASDKVVDSVKTTFGIQETNDMVNDSQYSIFPMNWDKLIDEAKRSHLDFLAQRANIDDYYPLNKEASPDISNMYI